MIRRVAGHKARTKDNELLQIITVYEEGYSKEQVKKELGEYCKKHSVLIINETKKGIKNPNINFSQGIYEHARPNKL